MIARGYVALVATVVLVGMTVSMSVERPWRRRAGAHVLSRTLCSTVWVAYAPTNFDPDPAVQQLPSDESLRADLLTLRRAGFDGLITYSTDVPRVPTVAEAVGFRQILLGVWNPASVQDSNEVVRAARNPRVAGVIIGNEGLMSARYDMATLRKAMDAIREATGKPVSTTETIEAFFTNRELAEASDFLTVNAHPYFRSLSDPAAAADWTIRAYDSLVARVPDKPVLFKEVGLPSAGDPALSEAGQAHYYTLLARSHVWFAYFEGFDAMFKAGPIEQSWGLFRANRTPKPAVSAIRSAGHRCPP